MNLLKIKFGFQNFLFFILFSLFSAEYCIAGQSITIEIKNQAGGKFEHHYDETRTWYKWHNEIYERDGSADYNPYLTFEDITILSSQMSSVGIQEEVDNTGRVLIQILNALDFSPAKKPMYANGSSTLVSDLGPGRYIVRCWATVQVTKKEYLDIDDIGIFTQGSDDGGRYEVIEAGIETRQISIFPPIWSDLKYIVKRYTYQVMSDTITYVFPGENDQALIILPQDPQILGEAAVKTGDNEVQLSDVNISDSFTNEDAKKMFGASLGLVLHGVPPEIISEFPKAFVGVGVTNLVMWTSVEDLAHEALKTGLKVTGEIVATKILVGTKLLPAASAGWFVTGCVIAYEVAPVLWKIHNWNELKHALAVSISDDLLVKIPELSEGSFPPPINILIQNYGAPLNNICFGETGVPPEIIDKYGKCEEFITEDIFTFTEIPVYFVNSLMMGTMDVAFQVPYLSNEWIFAYFPNIRIGDISETLYSIQSGVKWLRSHQYANGSWLDDPAVTSMAVLTMLNWDYDENDPIVSKGINYVLGAIHPDGSVYSNINRSTYYTAIAILPLAATNNPAYKDEIQRMRQWLIDLQWDESSFYGSIGTSHSYYGGWGYGSNSRPDLSNVQWALMGLKSADNRLGINAGDTYSKCANYFLARCQNGDGGSAYTVGDISIHTMTASSVWSYALCGMPNTAQVNRGVQWLTDRYSLTNNDGWGWWSEYYYKVTLAKALTMTHKTKLGNHDWFEELSQKLADEQYDAGNWPDTGMMGSEMSTCWAIMALQTRTLPPGGDYGMWANLQSHCDLHFYDQQGRHMGINYSTGMIENNIPGAIFKIINPGDPNDPNDDVEVPYNGSTPDEGLIQHVDISGISPGSYRLELVGTSDGSFHLTVGGTQNGQTVTTHTYEGIIALGKRLATNVTVTSMEGGITLLYEPLEELPVMELSPTEMELVVKPGELLTFSFTVSESGGEKVLRSVTPYCSNFTGTKMFVDGTTAIFDLVDFDVPAGGTQLVNVSIQIPADVNSVGAGQVIVESVNGGTKSISLNFVLDSEPPVVTVVFPTAGLAVQDGVPLRATAEDISEVSSLIFTIRERNSADPNGTPVGFEDLQATYNNTTGKWEYPFNSTQLPDGYYQIFAKAVDDYGNEGISEVIPFTIRNWAVVKLLPMSARYNLGRTVPIKFSLRISAAVDPAMPFVYNEDLEIRIFETGKPGTILQNSLFGDSSKDYRIDAAGQLYITNFKTGIKPTEYTVEIRRTINDFLVTSFKFKTEK